ncbi:3-deoxy-manno-octulosonate cytidylyltransferase [Priestia aryabhattai]|uniref:3-deoxy-manno-octulosonate cytidylyltransferase n=1 Tax=Priestia aryabhattai TaxID=412384 RepID=UPI003D28FED1
MKVVAVIPSRYGSTRFPGKPLAKILDKPMIQHVYERVKLSQRIDEIIVATDSIEISKVVQGFGGKCLLTSSKHDSGSERLGEVSENIDGDIFVNIQGDEPLIDPNTIDEIVETALNNLECVITAKVKIVNEEDANDPNIVKVVDDCNKNALYFSRSKIPFNRDGIKMEYYKHLGIYSYPKKILQEYISLSKAKIESSESLEQLRLLYNGYKIKVVETKCDAVGVDVQGDIKKVEAIIIGGN